MFERLDDGALVTAIGDSARAENKACARRLAAIAELYERRQIPVENGQGRELWRIDPWEAVAAEVAAAQGITSAAASAQLHNAICLHETLPKVGALFATGAISYRTVSIIVARTLLALHTDVLAAIDAKLVVARCAERLQEESAKIPLELTLRNLPKPERITTPMLVLGGESDASVTSKELHANAVAYGTNAETFPDMGHDMMLESGWQAVAERIDGWLTAQGL